MSSSWEAGVVDAHDDPTPAHPAQRPEPWPRARQALGEAVSDDELSGAAATLQRICRAATSSLSMLGSVVHVISPAGEGVVVASADDRSRRIGELAFAIAEAPCLSAFATERPVLVGDLLGEGQARWPGYVSAIRHEEVRAAYSFPLHVGAVRLGVLDLYGAHVHSLSPTGTSMAFVFADVATETLLEPPPGTSSVGLFDRGAVAMERRAEIHQAQGMVTVDLAVTLAEALALMRAHAFGHDLPLLEVARGIVAGGRLPIPAGDA